MLSIRFLQVGDSGMIADAFAAQGWKKPAAQYDAYFHEQAAGNRHVYLAFDGSDFAGYVTRKNQSDYPPFRQAGIPEISDLNVLKKFQRRGIARALLDHAEQAAHVPIIGIGVGLIEDYGPAQRLYIQRGYVPDGRGITYRNQTVHYDFPIVAGDDLVLWMTKELS